MPRAQLPVLENARKSCHQLLDTLGLVARDDDDAIHACPACRVDDVLDHGGPEDRVSDLGEVGLHTRSLAGREDQRRSGHARSFDIEGAVWPVLPHLRGSLAGAAGFEPADGGSKVLCLTAWLRPKTALKA